MSDEYIETIESRTTRFIKANTDILTKLRRHGVAVDGIGEEKVEFLFAFLVQQDIISEESAKHFNLAWAQYLHEKLREAQSVLNEKLEESRRKQLITPPSTALLLPDGRRTRGPRG